MTRKQKLKVYRTPIGFHDAYVAAPSQKAALLAWGADVDLFARGVAEAVTDEALAKAPLDAPGTVIRVARGTSDEHVAALPADPKPSRRRPPAPEDEGPRRRHSGASNKRRAARHDEGPDAAPATTEPHGKTARHSKPKPRPSTEKLDEAERSLERARSDREDEIADIRRQEKALQQKRREIEKRRDDEIAKLEASVAKARAAHSAALEKWRS